MIEQLIQNKVQVSALVFGALALLGYLYNSKDYRIVALLFFAVISQFIVGVQAILILGMGAIIFPRRIRTLALVLLTITFLIPREIRLYPFILLSLVSAEDYLGGDNWKKLKDAIPVFALLFLFKENYLFYENAQMVPMIVLGLFAIRMIIFASSILKVLHVFYLMTALASLFIERPVLDLNLAILALVLGSFLSFVNSTALGREIEKTLDGTFYHQPDLFFSWILSLAAGPLLLTSVLMAIDVALWPAFAVLQLQLSFRIFAIFTKGMNSCAATGERMSLAPALVIFFLSLLGALAFGSFASVEIGTYLFIWGGTLLGLATLYGISYSLRKSHLKLGYDVKAVEEWLDGLTWTIRFDDGQEKERINSHRLVPERLGPSNNFTANFPFLSILFLTLVGTLMIILRGLQL